MAYLSVKEGRLVSKAYNNSSKGKKLTPKMLSFIDQYFGSANFNALEAMRLSDYKCSTEGSVHQTSAELMNHPLVIAEIKRRTDLRSEKSEVKAEWLINKLMNIVNNTEEDNPAAAIRAIELLGKTIAIWRDRQEVSGPDGEAIKHEQHVKESVAEFTTRIQGLAVRSGTARGDEPGTKGNVVKLDERRGSG